MDRSRIEFSVTTYKLADLTFELVNKVFYFGFALKFIVRLINLHIKHGLLVLALFNISFGLSQLFAHIKKHISYDSSHLVLNIKRLLVILYTDKDKFKKVNILALRKHGLNSCDNLVSWNMRIVFAFCNLQIYWIAPPVFYLTKFIFLF